MNKSSTASLNVWLWFFVILGMLAAAYILTGRVASENSHRNTEWLYDYQALNDYARSQGLPLDSVLRSCRQAGVTSLAVEELNRDALALSGQARQVTFFELEDWQWQNRLDKAVKPDPRCCYYVCSDAAVAKKIEAGAKLSLGEGSSRVWPKEGSKIVELKTDPRLAVNLGLGIPKDVVSELHNKYGFSIWLRPWNSPALKPQAIAKLLKDYQTLPGVEGIIFGGLRNEVYGYPNELPEVAQALATSKLKLGVIELAPLAQQKGVQTLGRLLTNKVVRVMAISSAHQAKLDPQTVAAMFSLGVRERNIRLVYCRPYLDGVDELSTVEANNLLLQSTARELQGYLDKSSAVFVGQNSVKAGFSLLNLAFCLLSLGVGSGLALLLRAIYSPSFKLGLGLLVLLAFVTLVVCLTGLLYVKWRLLMGLLALTVFPILGFVLILPSLERSSQSTKFLEVLRDGWMFLAVTVSFAFLGGMLAAAFLPDLSFMLSLDVFRGVKLHGSLVPLVLFILVLVLQQRQGGLDGVIRFLNSRVKVWHVLVFTVLVIAAAIYLIRTGNDGGDVMVSEGERAFRRWLDYILGVRPRFKEFLLGAPCIILLPTLVMMRWRSLVPLAVIFAAIGLASVSDTYAHIHTPLMISVHRTILGTLIGGLIGTVAVYCLFLLKQLWHVFNAKANPEQSPEDNQVAE